MTKSMTGFASLKGHLAGWGWSWEIRSVNARGLDIRLRLPDWIDGLEQVVRKAVAEAVARGNVSVNLRLQRDSEDAAVRLNTTNLDRVLVTLSEIGHAAEQRGIILAPTSAADIVGMRGVLEAGLSEDDSAPLLAALSADLPTLLEAFNQMRGREGAALQAVLEDNLSEVEGLVVSAGEVIGARRDVQNQTLRQNLTRVMDNTDGADPDRVAQELALIAVKTDVREEIDRLEAHVSAARELLAGDGARGRKLDFLMQEFNREANTLCSKAQYQPLTRIGLDLKHVIDQMREQVQNVE